ncbi:MAG TPA: uridine kinase [Verrucomicrobiae bacterium]|jgi:uridine kinase
MKNRHPVHLVAITGGSGAGKTWLAERLQTVLGDNAARLSLDNFYRDRSDLPPARREKINFDDPRAIDWPCVEQVLRQCRPGQVTPVPRYDFTTHTRLREPQLWEPKSLILMDGLWLLHRRSIRRLFALRIFIDCPEALRLRRRLDRDVCERGRSESSVRQQFQATVAPMHERFVAPQATHADVTLTQPVTGSAVHQLADRMWNLLLLDSQLEDQFEALQTAGSGIQTWMQADFRTQISALFRSGSPSL